MVRLVVILLLTCGSTVPALAGDCSRLVNDPDALVACMKGEAANASAPAARASQGFEEYAAPSDGFDAAGADLVDMLKPGPNKAQRYRETGDSPLTPYDKSVGFGQRHEGH